MSKQRLADCILYWTLMQEFWSPVHLSPFRIVLPAPARPPRKQYQTIAFYLRIFILIVWAAEWQQWTRRKQSIAVPSPSL